VSLADAAAREPEVCFAATRALCNSCGRLTDAKVVFRGERTPCSRGGVLSGDERVYLAKWCPDHGRTEALISSDRDWYVRSLAYVKPGTRPRERAVAEQRGCPDSCGLCPEHQQHTCVPILEITGRCNLNCPVCLVHGSSPREDLSLEQVGRIVDDLVRYEGQLNMLNLSGGEPTLHPELPAILDLLERPEIGITSISTNGLALAERDELLQMLVDRGVVISLQYDGELPETYAALRGRPELASVKQRVVERVLALGGRLSLTVTLARGVNEGELPGILRLLFGSRQVLSAMIQPLCHTTARDESFDPMEVLTIPDVVRLLCESSAGVLEASDFSPLPCSHPTCFALTYLLTTPDDGLVPLPRIVEPSSYLDIIKNQALLSTDPDTLMTVRDSLYALWSSDGQVPDRDGVLGTVRQLLLELNRLGGSPAHREVLQLGARHVKSIFIHHFMDRYTFDLSRAVKCCNHYPQPDGRLLPVCVRNNLG
jgi:uncharacterized radical SAM superfamily Fe-S cluster-containing enzyme